MSRTVRNVHSSQSRLARYRAERLLRKGFPEHRAKVLAVVRSKLRAAGVSLDQADLEACYSQAWHGLYTQMLAGETIESPEGWLVLVSFRRAIDEARARSRVRPGAGEDIASAVDTAGAAESDLVGALDDRDRLRALFEALRSTLSTRECEAASLCYLQGLSRAQAAVQMGISERRMRKLMEGAGGGALGVAGKVGELLDTIQAGGWCEQQASLIRAYAFGILDPDGERHALAVAHTRQCPACRAQVAALRGLASVLPPLPLAFVLGAGRAPRAERPRLRGLARARHGLRAGAGTPGGGAVSVKLMVVGVALLGVVPAYLAIRPVARSAHAQATHTAIAPVAFGPTDRLVSLPHGIAAKRSRLARKRHTAVRASAKRKTRAPVKDSGVGGPAGEFSPERVRGESGSAGRVVAPPPAQPAAGAAREFGVE
ncbi:MAG TPA: sigma-70 family RNA polymerase sigma factor [Solirubrobacteraceae bacterium]|nr:sigma-70 family RNA polymerase sigma factor [Solirubrobacteraceae bacterium]